MALAIAILVLSVLPLLALATFMPRPFETAVLLLALFAAAVTGIVARDAFLATCAFLLLSSSVFTASTVAESARVLSPRRRAAPRRRPVRRAADAAAELQPWWELESRARDAA